MKKALTVGELLVAMSIIGVVTALVLPSFIQDYNKKIYVSKLRKTVATIEAAIEQACIDNNISSFSQTPYFNSKEKGQEFLDKYLNKSDGNMPFSNKNYKSIKTSYVGSAVSNFKSYTSLKDGTAVSYDSLDHKFFIDVNGSAPPNIGGRDYFSFFVKDNDNKLYDGSATKTRLPDSSICGNNQIGAGCYAKLIEDDWEMNY